MIGADDGRAILRRKVGCDFARDRARLGLPGTESASEGIDHSPLYFVHHFGREIVEI